MKATSGTRIIVILVIIGALALTGLVLPMLLSRSQLASTGVSNVAPAAGGATTNGTAVALPTGAVGARGIRGGVRSSPVPTTQGVSVSVPVTASAPLYMEVLSAAYTPSGKPSNGCGQIETTTQGQRFDFAVNIINQTGNDLNPGDWGAQAYSGGEPLTLCYFGQTAQLPTLQNSARTNITLVAFTDASKPVTSIVIGTTNGNEAKVCFAGDHVITC